MTNIFSSSRISHIAAVVAAGAAIAFAAPVQAQETDGQQRVAPRTEAGASARDQRRVCVEIEVTGSRMPRRVCRTRAEWNQQEGGLPN